MHVGLQAAPNKTYSNNVTIDTGYINETGAGLTYIYNLSTVNKRVIQMWLDKSRLFDFTLLDVKGNNERFLLYTSTFQIDINFFFTVPPPQGGRAVIVDASIVAEEAGFLSS